VIQELSFTESRPDGYDADTRVRFRHRRRTGVSAVTGRSQHVQWADAAKGVCIILVVAWHVGLPVPGLWGTLGEQFLPLRMPLFFAISGLFAANAVHRPWRAVARGRIAGFLYLYALWLLIHTVVLASTPDFPTDRATSALGLVAQLTITPSNLWYLYALALYCTLAKATRRLPTLHRFLVAQTQREQATNGRREQPESRRYGGPGVGQRCRGPGRQRSRRQERATDGVRRSVGHGDHARPTRSGRCPWIVLVLSQPPPVPEKRGDPPPRTPTDASCRRAARM
jgi:hypothetical protein